MKKKTAAKKEKKRKHKKHAEDNNKMEKGANGKYNGLYNSTRELKGKRKLQDRTPTSPHIAQDRNRCAAAKFCGCRDMPLSIRHRCVVCAFSLHPECGIELQETGVHRILATSINMVCKACAQGGDMMKFVQEGELSLRHYTVNKYLRPQYPLVQLIQPEEELSTSSEESSSATDESEEDENGKDMMEIDNNNEEDKSYKESEGETTTDNKAQSQEDTINEEKEGKEKKEEETPNDETNKGNQEKKDNDNMVVRYF